MWRFWGLITVLMRSCPGRCVWLLVFLLLSDLSFLCSSLDPIMIPCSIACHFYSVNKCLVRLTLYQLINGMTWLYWDWSSNFAYCGYRSLLSYLVEQNLDLLPCSIDNSTTLMKWWTTLDNWLIPWRCCSFTVLRLKFENKQWSLQLLL